ncbi:MAG: FAD-dependent oxidoreductase [Actinomycetota bacterium]
MKGTLHVVGAGLAGLACAVAAARAGVRVAVHEAAGHAGGRCRSFRDARLDRVIDNGTHLVLGANRTALAYARAIGGDEAMVPAPPAFPFLDLGTGKSWVVQANRLPVGVLELFAALGLPWTPEAETVAMRLGPTRSYKGTWLPLCEAIMNTPPEDASARMFARVLRRVLLRGPKALTPWLFPAGLSSAFVAPAVATLGAFGAEMRTGRRLLAAGRDALVFDDTTQALSPNDRVVLALPPWAIASVLPGEVPAMPTRAIVNAHFLVGEGTCLPGGKPFLALSGGTSQWLSLREDVISVTVSAADALADRPADDIAALLWAEVARVLGRPGSPQPPVRILKERRATLAHTPQAVARRPGHATRHPNLFLAGDWIESPWPCTIEAAITSGLEAARLAVGDRTLSFAP